MCGKRYVQAQPADGSAEGATIRLNAIPAERASHCRSGFPWWALWTIWPLMFLMKGATFLLTPLVAWLSQPLTLTLTPLPLLLIGAGVALLIVGALRRRNRE